MDLQGTIKQTNICIMGIPEGEEKKEQKAYFKNNGWKFPKSGEGNGYPNSRNLTDSTWEELKRIYTNTNYNEMVRS